MPDIAMCSGSGCPLRQTCYRCPASGTRPSSWQGWIMPPVKPNGSCDKYWPVGEPEDQRPKQREGE